MADRDGMRVEAGWSPGLLGWCVAEHGRYYAAHAGFGLYFETKVALEMAAFLRRLDPPRSQVFSASDGQEFAGTVSIDGSAGELEDGLAHLRWFIVAGRARGRGLGHALLAEALGAAREAGLAGVYLWTFQGLDAARAVYERAGFRLTAEQEDLTWGEPVREQRFEVRFRDLR